MSPEIKFLSGKHWRNISNVILYIYMSPYAHTINIDF